MRALLHVVLYASGAVQAGRFFNQARYDAQNKQRSEQCVARQKADDEAALLRSGVGEQVRDEFLDATDRKYRAARLRDAVGAQLQLHEFALDDRRDKYDIAATLHTGLGQLSLASLRGRLIEYQLRLG